MISRKVNLGDWIEFQLNGSQSTFFLFLFALRVFLGDECVKLLLLFGRQQGANPGARLLPWLFKTWLQLRLEGAIFVACLIEDRTDGFGLLVVQIQIATHLLKALMRRHLRTTTAGS